MATDPQQSSIDSLGRQAAEIMMIGAVDLFRSRGIPKPSDKLLCAVVLELKAGSQPALDEAMKDAKIAFEAKMEKIGESTFAASMKLAGIRAAERALALVPA